MIIYMPLTSSSNSYCLTHVNVIPIAWRIPDSVKGEAQAYARLLADY